MKETSVLTVTSPRAIDIQHVYAYIFNEEVMNVVVCDNYQLANDMAKGSYGDSAFAVDCSRWACGIGDKYINGVFYEADGVTPIAYIPDDRELAQAAKDSAELAHARIDEILTIMNTAKIPMNFEMNGGNVAYYRNIYFKNNMDINLVPNVGDLRDVIDPDWNNPNPVE